MRPLDRLSDRRAIVALVAVWLALNAAYFVWNGPAEREPNRRAVLLSPRTLQFYESPQQWAGGVHLQRLGGNLPFRLLQPPDRSEARRSPLLLFLHGAGQCGRDNQQQLVGLPDQMSQPDWRRRFPCFVLAPQCPDNGSWSTRMEDLENLVIRVCEDFPVDRRRVYVTGLSMGGFGAWELAARRPELFAAVVPICGGGEASWAERLKTVPLWAVHGDADETIPVASSRNMIQAIRNAGGRPLFTELPGVGHDSWTQTYRDPDGVLRWVFEQANDHAER
jgi:predicted peptidase